MQKGLNSKGDEWTVVGTSSGEEPVLIDVEPSFMIFTKSQAVSFAAAILEEAGETELAKMVREKVGT